MRRRQTNRPTRIIGLLGAVFVSAMLALAQPAGAASGLVVTYVTRGEPVFVFTAPDDWTVETGVEATDEGAMPRIVSLLPPDQTEPLWVGIWSPVRVGTIAEARAYLADLNLDLFEMPQIDREAERRVGGKAAYIVEGHGLREGRRMNFAIALVQLSPERLALAALIGTEAARAAHADALAAVVDSIRPAGGGQR